MKGRIIRTTGSWYVVKKEDGTTSDCRMKGVFRLDEAKNTNPVAVGDYVNVELEDQAESAVITEIFPRENYISRQSPRQQQARHIIASNIDQAFIIVTVAHPRTSTGFIDRFLVTAEAYHIPSHIVFNKQDIFSEKELRKQNEMATIYQNLSYPVHFVSAQTGTYIQELKERLKSKTILLAGHSGVGKSTLINALHPALNLKTDMISSRWQKGKHATTFAELFELPFGGFIIDTPGIKEFGVLDLAPEEVGHYFVEMRELLQHCKFNNCLHVNEPGCAVKAALEKGDIQPERYKNYLNIVEDSKQQQHSY